MDEPASARGFPTVTIATGNPVVAAVTVCTRSGETNVFAGV